MTTLSSVGEVLAPRRQARDPIRARFGPEVHWSEAVLNLASGKG